jgi:nucleotide-binding universal stress UspA family protein
MREGSAADEILNEARAEAVDLIAMGTHGRSGFEHLMLGSVTEKVLRKAPCPVMTVAPPAADAPAHDPTELRHVLCPIDFSEASKEALRYALSLAERARARLTLVHVIDWPERRHPGIAAAEYERCVTELAARELRDAVPADARNWCRVEERVLAGPPWKRILGLAAEEAPDLIVLGAHGHNALERFLFGSTANHVVRQARCPVVSVPLSQRPARAAAGTRAPRGRDSASMSPR